MGGVERIASQLLSQPGSNESFLAIDAQYYNSFISHFGADSRHIIQLDCSSPFKALISIKKCISRVDPDIIHTHARKEMVYVCLCNKKAIHVRTQHMAEIPRIPITRFEKALLKNKVNRWVATSHSLVDSYLKNRDYINMSKVSVIYNGAQEGLERSVFNPSRRFCVIGRLTRQKGIDILINEVSKLEEGIKEKICIDIWGEGEEYNTIIEMIDKLNLKSVFSYKGTTTCPSEVVSEYEALLMPSRYEGLPLTLLECMSTGTPVATHDVGCIAEFIDTGVNGWIINDHYTWDDFLKENISVNHYYQMCRAARSTYLKLFSLDKMRDEYYKLYKESIELTKEQTSQGVSHE